MFQFALIARRLLFILYLLAISPVASADTPMLVSTDWLQQHLSDKQVVIIDMSDSFQFQRFHIPGAQHLPYGAINRQTRQGVSYSVGPQTIAGIMGQLGVSADHTVVIYDDTGGLNAARLFWELQRLQHPHVAIVDGGLVKWIREGRNISWTTRKVKPVSYRARQLNTDVLSNMDELSKASVLLDVRSKEEYQGHPRLPRSGHIPRAQHFPWDSAVDFERDFTMKPAAAIKSHLAQLGLTDPKQQVTLYCRSGHRAAHVFFTLKRLGWNKLRLYDGSMAEYERNKTAPLKMGMQP